MQFIIIKLTIGTREEVQLHWTDHLSYVRRLKEEGQILSAGTFSDGSGGTILIEAADLEEAINIARQDPLVKAGVDTYQLQGWISSTNGAPEEKRDAPRPTPGIAPTMPLELPASEDSFQLIDVTNDPGYADFRVSCLAPQSFPKKRSLRLDFLNIALKRGLRKLVLLHEGKLAGQVEFAPSETCGLPLRGTGLTVIHCLWVVDTFTGLGGGRRLLSTCAKSTEGSSLATVAYNANLPWMPRSFFESQGFLVVDQLETGRFFNNTPIVAYLLWHPLHSGARPPTWNKDKLLEGVDFCPAYPWMFGRRLYWGQEFDYHGMLIKEGLRRQELLQQLPQLSRRQTEKWTVIKFGLPEADLNRALELIQAGLHAEPTYYAHVYGSDRLLIVFPDRIFRLSKDPNTWGEAIRYGLEKGIPVEELTFRPIEFKDEEF